MEKDGGGERGIGGQEKGGAPHSNRGAAGVDQYPGRRFDGPGKPYHYGPGGEDRKGKRGRLKR